MAKQQQIVVTDLTPDSNEMGLVVRPIGGTGGGDVTIIAPLPLPVAITEPIGSNVAADSVSVTLATDEDPIDVNIVSPNPLPVTASFVPIISTNSGLLDGNGDEVVLELNGASGASALFPDAPNDFNGTVVFETSSNGGVEYNEVQANSKPSWEASNPVLADVQPSNSQWIFCLSGGETHIKVRVTSYVSGSVTVTLTGTAVNSDPVQNATFAGGGGNRPVACVLIGGRVGVSNDARPVSIASDNDVANDQAFVVRDMAGTRRVGAAMTGANDFGKAIGGIDDTDVFQFAEIRDTDPVGNENGVIVRNIPSGTQPISTPNVTASAVLNGAGDTLTIDAAGLQSVGFIIEEGTLSADILLEQSIDGVIWDIGIARITSDLSSHRFIAGSYGLTNPNPRTIITAVPTATATLYRIRVTSYTSGTADAQAIASTLQDKQPLDLSLEEVGQTLSSQPYFITKIGSIDNSNIVRAPRVLNFNPVGTEYGLIVRNIPGSSIQGIAGAVDQGVGSVNQGDAWITQLSDSVDGPVDVAALNEALSPTSFALLVRAHITDAGGTAADVTAANALKVDGSAVTQPISAVSLPLPTGAATEGKQDTGNASLSIIDDWDESDRAKVNPIVGQAGVQGGAGVVTALTQRVAIATDANVISTKTDLTPASPAATSVGVASAQAVAANATRKGLDLINVSNARISLGFGAAAVLDSGVTLYPGGSFSMDDYSFDLGAVNAIASAAASPLAIQEYNT